MPLNEKGDGFVGNPAETFTFWNVLSAKQKDSVNNRMVRRTCMPYEEMEMDELFQAQSIWTIQSGAINLNVYTEDGRTLLLTKLRKGQEGYSVPVRGNKRTPWYCVRAECKERSEILILPSDVCQMLLQSCEEVRRVRDTVTDELLAQMVDMLCESVFLPFKTRLLHRVYEYGQEQNRLSISITHERIANEMGTSREVVSRLLKQLEAEHMLKLGRGNITIL